MVGYNQSESRSRSSPYDLTPPQLKALRGPAANLLRSYIAGDGGYEGAFVAELTPEERELLRIVGAQGGERSPLESASAAQLQGTLRGDYADPNNPLVQAAIRAAQRPAIEAFREASLADRAAFTLAGHRVGGTAEGGGPSESSPFARARALAQRGLANSLTDISSEIVYGNLQAERDRQIRAASAAEQLEQGEFNRAVQALEAAALPRLIEQLGIDRGIEEFNRRIQLALTAAGIVFGNTVIAQESKSYGESAEAGISYGGSYTG